MDFKLVSEYSATGDQPEAIRERLKTFDRLRKDIYDGKCYRDSQYSDPRSEPQ